MARQKDTANGQKGLRRQRGLSPLASRGLRLLSGAWKIALRDPPFSSRDKALAMACDTVFAGNEAGYKKAIVIQAAGKAANVSLDARAMQKGDGNPGSWDAREFAKQTFVAWNIASQYPYAHSADPYVSNPYRVERFGMAPDKKPKRPTEYAAAAKVLSLLQNADSPAIAFHNLVEVMLALRRYIADRSVEYPLPNRASLSDTLRCVNGFVAAKSGGARLQAIVFALFNSLQRSGMSYRDLHSRHVNASDASATAAGDITFLLNAASVAVEVKDRSLDAAELEATIEKCRIGAIKEIVFVIRASDLLASDLPQDDFEARRKEQFSSGLNLYIESFDQFCEAVLTLVGEVGRRDFLEGVGIALTAQNADVTHKWAWAALVKLI